MTTAARDEFVRACDAARGVRRFLPLSEQWQILQQLGYRRSLGRYDAQREVAKALAQEQTELDTRHLTQHQRERQTVVCSTLRAVLVMIAERGAFQSPIRLNGPLMTPQQKRGGRPRGSKAEERRIGLAVQEAKILRALPTARG